MGRRAVILLMAVVLIVAAGSAALYDLLDQGPDDSAADAPGSASRGDVPSALADLDHASFPEPLIDTNDIVRLLPPDQIPAIDEPKFQPAGEADWLEKDEPVLSLTVGDETRAYPLQIMTWHEIANDTVGGVPVAVTYCPLCNSGVAFERELDGQVLDFGVSGMLYVDNLIMFDRQTQSLWPQLTGEASVGHLTGSKLTPIPMGVVGWDQFRSSHPDSLVLTRDTGHQRDYGTNPYVEYDDPGSAPLVPPPGEADDRLPLKQRVVGIERDGEAVAINRDDLRQEGAIPVELGGEQLVAWHRGGQRSALGEADIASADDIGTVGVFSATRDGERLTFTPVDGGFRDDQTGSTWSVVGEAVSGPAEGERLDPITHLDTFWFAWVGFHPETELLE
jgi:hypothetical protein